MGKRYATIWFPYLQTDWFSLRQPDLRKNPFVLVTPDHGRLVISATNDLARAEGIHAGMVLADARALYPAIHYRDDKPQQAQKLLRRIAEWFVRYTPRPATDGIDTITLDCTGCTHLWGGDQAYLTEIISRLNAHGYSARAAMASTIGCAKAMVRFGPDHSVIAPGEQAAAIMTLPPAALAFEEELTDQLDKLGLRQIGQLLGMPRSALRRRFGQAMVRTLDQATGLEEEMLVPVVPEILHQERLPCLEPIVTRVGISIALQRLLGGLCERLQKEGKGMRQAVFKGFRVDGHVEQIAIGTNRPSHHAEHLSKLFEPSLSSIEPALGIELFTLDALKVEEVVPAQERLWEGSCRIEDLRFSELMDRFANKFGAQYIHRFFPREQYWPECSFQPAASFHEPLPQSWTLHKPRPVHLLARPQLIEVTAPIPDYPPMLFRYKGVLHTIKKADGPERIERSWWLGEGAHRDYYYVEDEAGRRYWLFRSGHYTGLNQEQWFLHGYFA